MKKPVKTLNCEKNPVKTLNCEKNLWKPWTLKKITCENLEPWKNLVLYWATNFQLLCMDLICCLNCTLLIRANAICQNNLWSVTYMYVRTTCAKVIITTGRDCGSAEWIKNTFRKRKSRHSLTLRSLLIRNYILC